jgi:exodeoxyribonuclease VII large subunit
MDRQLQAARARVDALAQRPVLARPQQRLQDWAWETRLVNAQQQAMARWRQDLRQWAGKLDALSPLAVLGRGYSLTQRADTGEIVRSVNAVREGDILLTRLRDGQLTSQVRGTETLAPQRASMWNE